MFRWHVRSIGTKQQQGPVGSQGRVNIKSPSWNEKETDNSGLFHRAYRFLDDALNWSNFSHTLPHPADMFVLYLKHGGPLLAQPPDTHRESMRSWLHMKSLYAKVELFSNLRRLQWPHLQMIPTAGPNNFRFPYSTDRPATHTDDIVLETSVPRQPKVNKLITIRYTQAEQKDGHMSIRCLMTIKIQWLFPLVRGEFSVISLSFHSGKEKHDKKACS